MAIPDLIGVRLLDRYELIEELGRGGMGVVYRARDPVLSREVAVKMILDAHITDETEERFRREARIVAGMDHPAIVPIHDFGRHEVGLFFIMPVVDGESLRTAIRRRNLRLGAVLDVIAEAADALDYSHDLGIVHRDIKPENILVNRSRGKLRVRVMDFGLALGQSDERLTRVGGLTGTVEYLSPEQIAGWDTKAGPVEVDGRSDLYSLGTVLFECLTGEKPFSGPLHVLMYRIAHEAAPQPRSQGMEIDLELEEIVLSCLEKNPDDRPQTGRELAAALRTYQERLQRSESRGSALKVSPHPGAAGSLPIVGRHLEIVALRDRLNSSLRDECQLVLISGEAGMGKTRLLLEVENLAVEQEVLVLRGHCAGRGGALPYQGFGEIIRDFFQRRDTASKASSSLSSSQAAEERLGEDLDMSDLGSELLSLFPMLGEIDAFRASSPDLEVVDAGVSGEPSPAMNGAAIDPTRVFEILARTLTRIAQGRPMLLILENLHAGEASTEALEYVVRRLGPAPILVVGTYRPSEAGSGHPVSRLRRGFEGDSRFLQLHLEPLDERAFRRWVELLIGESELPDSLVKRLFDATEGNPFFVQELVRSLIDSSRIRRDESGMWSLSGLTSLSRDALPTTIQQAVGRRIQRLPESERKLLSLASVLGREFQEVDLIELLVADGGGEDLDFDEVLDHLIGGGLLEEGGAHGDGLSFAGGIVREVLYDQLSRRRRRRLHRRHAERLEVRFAQRLERVYPQLVHHFSAGDVPEKTVAYARASARNALDAGHPEDAIGVLETALEMIQVDDLDATDVEPQAAGELYELLASAHRIAGRSIAALREAELAVTAFNLAGNRARAAGAALQAAEVAWQGRRIDAAGNWVERGVVFAREERLDDVLRSLLHLGAVLANLRGDAGLAKVYLEEADSLIATGETEQTPIGGELTVCLTGEVEILDPALFRSDAEIETGLNLFDTLLEPEPGGQFAHGLGVGNVAASLSEGGLCESRHAMDDDRVFTLRLRAGQRFSDGTPLDAEAVVRSFERLALAGRETVAGLRLIAGAERFQAGETESIEGLRTFDDDPLRVEFHLVESSPIFPVLLTDPRTSIVRETDEGLVGTGPFRLRSLEKGRIVLERNENHSTHPPALDRIVWRTERSSDVAEALREGRVDLGRDLPAEDLEMLLRDRRFRGRLVESTKNSVAFLIFQCIDGRLADSPALRRALFEVVRVRDLVWGALGRFAHPATGLIPPGVLGHDPGRPPRTMSMEQAREVLRRERGEEQLVLRAAVHPLFLDRDVALLRALSDLWARLGVRLESVTRTMDEFMEREDGRGVDLMIARWNANYCDPDDFTHGLLHSRWGLLRRFTASEEADRLLERAREARDPARRLGRYQRCEELLTEEGRVLALYHDVDYRVAGPDVRGLRLQGAPPYVDYVGLCRGRETARIQERRGGEIHVPIAVPIRSLDPALGYIAENIEVFSNVYETLTTVDAGARIVPHLAEWTRVGSGRTYRFELRRVRFHDGRPLSAEDVRYSFERLLRNGSRELHAILDPIRGARAFSRGEAKTLEGLRILSPRVLEIDLESAPAHFPALLTHPSASIVPEGGVAFCGSWNDQCAGTGPFRVRKLVPEERIELEPNPTYWRDGAPRCDRLVFHCSVTSREAVSGLRSGHFGVASGFEVEDLAKLRRDPEMLHGFVEAPRLATHFLAFNVRSGILADLDLRRELIAALHVDNALQETIGETVERAHGLIPPGLLNDDPRAAEKASEKKSSSGYVRSDPRGRLRAAVLASAYKGPYASLWGWIERVLKLRGFELEVRFGEAAEVIEQCRLGEIDLVGTRWSADFPDADSIVSSLLPSGGGILATMIGSEELDALVDEGRRESDPAARQAIYRRIEDSLAREAAVLPLFHDRKYCFANAQLRGLRLRLVAPEVSYEELSIAEDGA